MSDKIKLVTDEDALAYDKDLRERSYIDIQGNEISGEDVVRSIETGTNDTSKLDDLPDTDPAETKDAGILNKGSDLVNSSLSYMAESRIIGKFLKSDKNLFRKGLTMATVWTLRKINILPTSVAPLVGAASSLAGTVLGDNVSSMLEKVGEFIPAPTKEDNSFLTGVMTGTINTADSVIGFIKNTIPGGGDEVLSATGVTEGSDYLERDASDVTVATAENRVRAIYENVFGEEAPDLRKVDKDDVCKYMRANGKLMAEDGVFASCAAKADTDREFAGMRAVTAASCAVMEDLAARPFGKDDAAEGIFMIAEGLAAYESGAREGFAETYPDGSEKAEAGLDKVMAASRGPVAESILNLQEKYGLFSDKEMEQLKDLIPELAMSDPDYGYGDEFMPDESVLTAHLEQPSGPVTEPAAAFTDFKSRRLPDVPSEELSDAGPDYGRV